VQAHGAVLRASLPRAMGLGGRVEVGVKGRDGRLVIARADRVVHFQDGLDERLGEEVQQL